MMFPVNGNPVTGFLIGVVTSEKFPCRINAVGTDPNVALSASARTPSYAPMKNVRLWPS
jgi:hypothetical protein